MESLAAGEIQEAANLAAHEPQASSPPLSTGATAPLGSVVTAKEPEPEPDTFSSRTEEIVKHVKSTTPGWEAAREQVIRDMATADKTTPSHPRNGTMSKRGGKQMSSLEGSLKAEGETSAAGSAPRGRRRGRPPGRARGAGRGGKRKREDGDEGKGLSSDSEVTTPVATMTKSGRNVQKPTSFVPPPEPSPIAAAPVKRKRTYRKNPESAVCKVCLRGTSPTTNMIVFCDGCNTPYHRFCHHPPIDQSVIDEVDKEWYCKQCRSERKLPVPESQIADFVAAQGAPQEQRLRYFASLPQGMLITLLTRATTLHPDLPLFSPDFRARNGPRDQDGDATAQVNNHPTTQKPPKASSAASAIPASGAQSASNRMNALAATASADFEDTAAEDEEDGYPDHPPTYPRPGHGLMKTLPPEQEDLQWLVEENDKFGVFTHMYQVDRPTVAGSANGGAS